MEYLLSVQGAALSVVAVAAMLLAAYGLGLAWSRGWHRGKKEFVTRLVKDSCADSDQKEGI